MQSLIFVSIFLLSLLNTPAALAADKRIGYRVIRTSPQEFKKAIWMSETNTRGAEDKSRLTKFFRIKDKKVRQEFVTFKVELDFPVLSEYYETSNLVAFKVTDQNRSTENARLDIDVQAPFKNIIHGYVEILPHEVGSLLTFYVIDSTYSDWAIDLFTKSFQLVHFIAADPNSATKQTVKELK